FLFELPVQQMPPRVEERLFAIRRAPGRLLPVMAHPERYAALWDDQDRVARLRTQAALVIDLGALDGAHGRAQCKAARAWEKGWSMPRPATRTARRTCASPPPGSPGSASAWAKQNCSGCWSTDRIRS